MIRLTHNTLQYDREEIKALYAQAVQLHNPLLYIDAVNGVPFLSSNAEIYDWLTEAMALSPSISEVRPTLPLPDDTIPSSAPLPERAGTISIVPTSAPPRRRLVIVKS